MRALLIGRGVQGKRWFNNLVRLGYEVKMCGRDYRNKINGGEKYNLLIIAVPHKAFLEVVKYLYKEKVSSERIILEKPGASNLEEFLEIKENLESLGCSEMFLPLYIEYKYIEPKYVTYLVKINKEGISEVTSDYIIMKNGRILDRNVIRDLFFHPASLYRDLNSFSLEYRSGDFPYEIYFIKGKGRIVLGRYNKSIRRIDGHEIVFHNPMEEHIKKRYKELELNNLPLKIWLKLDEILNKNGY